MSLIILQLCIAVLSESTRHCTFYDNKECELCSLPMVLLADALIPYLAMYLKVVEDTDNRIRKFY
jgi:hypothetical protein